MLLRSQGNGQLSECRIENYDGVLMEEELHAYAVGIRWFIVYKAKQPLDSSHGTVNLFIPQQLKFPLRLECTRAHVCHSRRGFDNKISSNVRPPAAQTSLMKTI